MMPFASTIDSLSQACTNKKFISVSTAQICIALAHSNTTAIVMTPYQPAPPNGTSVLLIIGIAEAPSMSNPLLSKSKGCMHHWCDIMQCNAFMQQLFDTMGSCFCNVHDIEKLTIGATTLIMTKCLLLMCFRYYLANVQECGICYLDWKVSDPHTCHLPPVVHRYISFKGYWDVGF